MIPFVLRVVPNNHEHLGFLPLSFEDSSSFIKRGFLSHRQDFKSVCLLKNGVLMSSLSPFSLPSREWPSIFIIKGRGEAGFTFPPEHKHFIARGMWVIAVGGNVPLSKIRSYLNISGCSSQLSPAEAFIGMYGGAYTVVTFNTILDYRGQ